MLGGHIKVISQEDIGSLFAVYMPYIEATTILKQRGFTAPIIMLTVNVNANVKTSMLADIQGAMEQQDRT